MSRPVLPLFAVSSLALAQWSCGAADSLSPELPFEAGTADAAPDQTTFDQSSPPVQDASPESAADASTPPDASTHDAQDAMPYYDGPVPDTGAHATKSCTSAGGLLCTEARWELCPIGFEPVAAGDGHFNCGYTHDGWCCQPAPMSSCTMSGAANCVPNACTGCFAPSPNSSLQCEPGRACCVDMCN